MELTRSGCEVIDLIPERGPCWGSPRPRNDFVSLTNSLRPGFPSAEGFITRALSWHHRPRIDPGADRRTTNPSPVVARCLISNRTSVIYFGPGELSGGHFVRAQPADCWHSRFCLKRPLKDASLSLRFRQPRRPQIKGQEIPIGSPPC